ncbi:Uncharacterised protein [Shigella sonnei]|nr:Uncharacterised protein [Shigella sonnei]CSR95995.1 Uncharacterised protein [Shigella sonnei]
MQGNSFRQHPRSVMEHPRRLPTTGGQQGTRPVSFLYAFQFFIEHVEGFIPAHAHKTVITALGGIAEMALTQPVHAYHRITNTRRVVYVIRQSGNHFRRIFIQFERFCRHKATILHRRADSPPVRPGKNALFRDDSLSRRLRRSRTARR